MSKPFDELKVLRILTNVGEAEPDYTECETAGEVLDEAQNTLSCSAGDHVAPVFMQCEDGWYMGVQSFEFYPVEESQVPLDDEFIYDSDRQEDDEDEGDA